MIFPGFDGGAEWGGAAFDPETALLFVNSNEMAWRASLAPSEKATSGRAVYLRDCAVCHRDDLNGTPPQFPSLVGIGKRKTDAELTTVVRNGTARMPGFPKLSDDVVRALVGYMARGENRELDDGRVAPVDQKYRFTGYHKFLDPDGYPAVAPPWGTLNAIDLNTGEYAWTDSARRISGPRGEGTEEHGHRELRRADRDRRRPRVHRRDELRQEVPRVRQGHGHAAVGNARCRSPATRRRRHMRSTAGSSS